MVECVILAELLFSLPASNGKLERVFSTLATIKVDKRSCLRNESLDDLLILNSPRIPIKSFNPDPSNSESEAEDMLESWNELIDSDSD